MFYYLGKAKDLRERALILKGRSAGDDGESSGQQKPQEKNRAIKQTTTKK